VTDAAPADDAFEQALRATRHRDRSASDVDRWLSEREFDEDARADALARLIRTGLVDDERFAWSRAESLAGRGAGDERIRQELRNAGIDRELAEAAIAALEPEALRADRVVARRGGSAKTLRYLRANGFAADVAAGAVASGSGEALR